MVTERYNRSFEKLMEIMLLSYPTEYTYKNTRSLVISSA
jgi:hypothetical protein